jgi:hypothetical protein
MKLSDTMPDMSTLMDRQQLVGWVVRDRIQQLGITYTEASRRWPISLPTLNRLMNSGNVGLRFYRVVEANLDMPIGLFDLIIDGDIDGIRSVEGVDQKLRQFILTGLGEDARGARRRRS